MKPPHPELNAAELRTIASRLMLIAEKQDQGSLENGVLETSSIFGDECLAEIARDELELRRSRHCFLDDDLFSEPAWDILLDLFLAQMEGRDVTVSGACVASGVPRTTALRYIDDLEERGLVLRFGSDTDRRVQHLAFTHFGMSKIKQTLRHYAAMRLRRDPVIAGGPPSLTLIK